MARTLVDAVALLRGLTLRIPPPGESRHQLVLPDDEDELDVIVFVETRWYGFGLEATDTSKTAEEVVDEIVALVAAEEAKHAQKNPGAGGVQPS